MVAPRRTAMKKRLLILLLFGVIAGIATGYFYIQLNKPLASTAVNQDSSGSFQVSEGASLNKVLSSLVEQGIVDTPLWVFKVYARLTSSEGTIKTGEYSLDKTQTTITLLASIRAGKVITRTIRFPEGWTFTMWRESFKSHPLLKKKLAGYTDYSLMRLLGRDGVHPEGQFFPDTYTYQKGDTDISILIRAHQRMRDVLETEWSSRTEHNVFANSQEALILASIIEKETAWEPDRVRVAAVFVNRLKKKMKLQTDPTVIYGIDDFDGNLRRKDLRTKTPYNTYIIPGLPPTPICNPGLSSIKAALQPITSNNYYFVARGDGTSEFSETLAQHNRAVTRFQKSGKIENYRSTPSQ